MLHLTVAVDLYLPNRNKSKNQLEENSWKSTGFGPFKQIPHESSPFSVLSHSLPRQGCVLAKILSTSLLDIFRERNFIAVELLVPIAVLNPTASMTSFHLNLQCFKFTH